MSDLPFVVLGAQGHAAVVVDLIQAIGGTVAGCVGPPQETVFGLKWLGDDHWLHNRGREFRLANGIGSTGDATIRAKAFDRFVMGGFDFPVLIHPSASVAPSARLSPGVQVMRGALIQPLAEIGDNAIVNTGAIVEHHCALGDHVHVAPGAILCGGVTIDSGTHVGAGATVLQNVAIGAAVTIGAGAVVIANVPDGETVVGVPAATKK